MSTKTSPFVLSADSLARLKVAALAHNEPAVVDLVGYYERAQNDANEFAEMLSEEMQHYGVA